MKAEQRYYLTADRSRLVPEGDPAANELFAIAGATISAADAKKYGLALEEADEPQPETKAVKAAPANKAVQPGANK